jgi:hypothetical protein
MMRLGASQLSEVTHSNLGEAVEALRHNPQVLFTTCHQEFSLQQVDLSDGTGYIHGPGFTRYFPQNLPDAPEGCENIMLLDYNEQWNSFPGQPPHLDYSPDGENRIVALAVEGQDQGVLIYLPKSIGVDEPLLEFSKIYSTRFFMSADSALEKDALENEDSKLTKLIEEQFGEYQVPTNMIICFRAWNPQNKDPRRLYLPHRAPQPISCPRRTCILTFVYE